MSHENYISRTPHLLKSFDRAISLVKPVLIARYGEEANALIQASRQKYYDLIPQIPYVGENNPLVDVFYLPASRHLGIYKAFQEHGKTVEEVGQLVYEIGEAEIEAIPGFVRRVVRMLWFSRWLTTRLQKRAALSQESKYPGGYVVTYLQGDGKEFDYEFDYIECAVYQFFPTTRCGRVGSLSLCHRQDSQRVNGMGIAPNNDFSRWRCEVRFSIQKGW